MSDNFPSLLKQYHVFYEVSPYYVEIENRPVGLPVTTRTVQAGFNIDVYGMRTEDHEPMMPPPHDYALGYAELQKLAATVSQHTEGSCSLEVIPFSSTAIIDTRANGKVEAMLRITVSHRRGLAQPAGAAERRVLEEVEKELRSRGVARR
jgi:hypothetical protein